MTLGGSTTSGGHNIDGGSSCGFLTSEATDTSLEGTNPLLATPLALNGGTTLNFALMANSPAIDLVPLASCKDGALVPLSVTRDQRGVTRPQFAGGACDAGAFEVEKTAPFVPGTPPVGTPSPVSR